MKRRSFFGLVLLPILGLGKAFAKGMKFNSGGSIPPNSSFNPVLDKDWHLTNDGRLIHGGPLDQSENTGVRQSISCRECVHWGDDEFSDRFPSVVNVLSSQKSYINDNLGRTLGHGVCPIWGRPTWSDDTCIEATFHGSRRQPFKG